MGGHGAWHVGIHHLDLFATLGTSAGGESFYSYGGASRSSAPMAWARSHSDTLNFIDNLSQRSVYISHGDQDQSVPMAEGQNLYDEVSQVCDDVVYHEESRATHWWDGDASPGVDCVDWPRLFEFMQTRDFNTEPLYSSRCRLCRAAHDFTSDHGQTTPQRRE